MTMSAFVLLLAQQEPAFDEGGYRDRLRRNLEIHCRVHPFHRDCPNLINPAWRPPVPRCTPTRETS
jgi:hypothetical protein